jgi:uncharacterized protein YceH (UPF0502 family)
MLDPALTDVEVRILGALIEKAATTPDNYPLSPSALAAACNQASNREPVMRLSDEVIADAVVALRRRSLLRAIQPAGARITKYQHLLDDALSLDRRELAVLCVLMLRGPQTPGELHTRTARLADFTDLADLQGVVDALGAREAGALATTLPRRPGQKEVRYAQLLGGDVTGDETPDQVIVRAAPSMVADGEARIAQLEQTVGELRDELAALRVQLDEFRAQFQ